MDEDTITRKYAEYIIEGLEDSTALISCERALIEKLDDDIKLCEENDCDDIMELRQMRKNHVDCIHSEVQVMCQNLDNLQDCCDKLSDENAKEFCREHIECYSKFVGITFSCLDDLYKVSL